jgi:hypothetical protein
MAILGESFKDYVRNQINVRQDKLSLNQNRDNDFLTYVTSKTSFLRLTSGVNISEKVAQSLGATGLSGNLLAKQYVLFSSRFSNNTLVSKDPDIWGGDLTSDIGYKGYSTSYGFASDPNYGLVPPPGLTMATINTLNRGTIREATINLICHNLYQFKAINALFLKLKYSLLLEWGHTLYFDNNSELVSPVEAGALNLSNDFLEGMSSDKILNEIEKKREESNGNYDAFFGVVKNFNWELQENGSYNIMVNAISQGDVIDSLKINTNLTPEQNTEGVEPQYQKSTLHKILGEIIKKIADGPDGPGGTSQGFLHGYKTKDNEIALNTTNISNFTGVTSNYKDPLDTDSTTSGANNIITNNEGLSITFPQLEADAETKKAAPQFYIKLGTLLRIIESFLLYYDLEKQDENKSHPSILYIDHDFDKNECLTTPRHISVDPLTCIIPIDFDNASEAEGNMSVTSFFNSIIKNYTLVLDGGGTITNDSSKIVEERTNLADSPNPAIPEDTETVTGTSDSFGNSLTKVVNNQSSIQDAIVLIQQNAGDLTGQTITITTQTITRTTQATISNESQAGNLKFVEKGFRTDTGSPYIGKTMHIYVNIDKIIEVLNNNIDGNGDVLLQNFLTQLMGSISSALCSINNFDLDYDESTNRFSIIDTAVFPLKYKNVNNVAKFNINLLKDSNSGGGSFVTNFGLKSDVFGQISNAIAIGAQGNGNNLGSNSTPISSFNEGLTDRMMTVKGNANSVKADPNKGFYQWLKSYTKYEQFKIKVTSESQVKNESITQTDIDLYRSFLVDMMKYDLGVYTTTNNIPGTGFIPLNLQLTMDGLSGIRQYQTFDIDETLLPSEYNDKLKFITTTVTNKIDTKGWETTINSLGVPKNNKDPKPVDQNIPQLEIKVEPKKTVDVEEITSSGNCTTKYKELPVLAEFSKTLLSYKDTKKTLVDLFGNTPLAKNIFIVMAAEASKENGQFRSAGHYNYAGVQTDSGRWGGGVDKYFNGQFCRKDAVKYRMFAAFKDNADFLRFMGDRLTAKGFNTASTGDAWVTTYINKWWSPAAKNEYTKGTEKYNQKLSIYNTWSTKWDNLA